jgi:hypothetical protein
MNSFGDLFQNFKKAGFFLKLKFQKYFCLWNKTKKQNKIPLRSQNETFHMWGQDNEQFWWFFFQNFKKVGF